MKTEKNLLGASTSTLILKLLEEKDMYGYEMIDTLSQRSDKTFELKAGTLYPILHALEKKGFVNAYETRAENDRIRKYYTITTLGRGELAEQEVQWERYSNAVNKVLKGGTTFGMAGI